MTQDGREQNDLRSTHRGVDFKGLTQLITQQPEANEHLSTGRNLDPQQKIKPKKSLNKRHGGAMDEYNPFVATKVCPQMQSTKLLLVKYQRQGGFSVAQSRSSALGSKP